MFLSEDMARFPSQYKSPYRALNGVRHVTDGQTGDGHQRLMPNPMGSGHNKQL